MTLRDFIPTRHDWLRILKSAAGFFVGIMFLELARYVGETSELGSVFMPPIMMVGMGVIWLAAL